MQKLIHSKCENHPQREAAARCPACGRFFCRECITEHDGKALCSSCLTGLSSGKKSAEHRLSSVFTAMNFTAGFILIWLVFFSMGKLLIALPADFHEGTLWEKVLPGNDFE